MVLMDIGSIETKLPISFELLKYYLKTIREDLFLNYDIFVKDGSLFGKLPGDKTVIPIYVTTDMIQDLLQKENIIVNILGSYDGSAWSYFVFANKSPIPQRMQTCTTYKDAQIEAYVSGLAILNDLYTTPLPKTVIVN